MQYPLEPVPNLQKVFKIFKISPFNINFSRSESAALLRASLHTDAQTTVDGIKKARVHCKMIGTKSKSKSSKNKIKFGNDKQTAVGSIGIRIPLEENFVITEHRLTSCMQM